MIDGTVVKDAKRGDARAFEAIVAEFEKKVYNLSLRFSGNEQDALDITQEVFIKVYSALPAFREQSSFSTWIYRITSNACIDYSRKNSKNSALSLSVDDEDHTEHEIPDADYSPESVYDRKELREEIASAIVELPEMHRQILIMRDISGLSYAEIASILYLEEGTVKSRIARARESLRLLILRNGNFFTSKSSKEAERRA